MRMNREDIPFLLILILAILLRIYNLEVIPHWFWDEGVNMHYSWNIVHGKLQWFCLSYAFVPHPPLYLLISGILLKIFGNNLIVLRGLSVFYSILTLILMYLIVRNMFDRNMALLASFIFAIYPFAIFWNRMAFANNQVMFLSFLCLYLFLKYLNDGKNLWLYLLSISTASSLITEIMGFCALVSILILFYLYDRQNLWRIFILSIIPFIIFVISMLLIMPDAFIHDILHHLGRTNFGILLILPIFIFMFILPVIIPLSRCKDRIIEFYSPVINEIRANTTLFYFIISPVIIFMTSENFTMNEDVIVRGLDLFWFGIIGIYFVGDKMKKNVLLAFFIPLLAMILWLDRADHMLIPLHPYICIFLAILFYKLFKLLNNKSVVALIVFYPLLLYPYYDINLYILNTWLNKEDINGRMDMVEFINSHVNGSDFVIADSHTTRFINCRTSVLPQTAAIKGKSIAYYASDYKPERFLFNCSHENAKFIVIENGTIKRVLNQNCLRDIILEIQNWSIHRINNYIIFENPRFTRDR